MDKGNKKAENTHKIAALADIHMHESLKGVMQNIFIEISKKAEVLLLCGDLTDHGYIEEAEMLSQELNYCNIPVIGVLGNHDYANDHQDEIKQILTNSNMFFLDKANYIHDNIGFSGVKGFAGGFNEHILASFGEDILRKFVYTSIEEALNLENSLNSLETEIKIVVLHYAPVKDTVIGESEEIYPFMGSSRLAEPADFFNVKAIFHGHSHHGQPEGKTLKGIPVYNVSYPLLKKINEKEPYKIIEI